MNKLDINKPETKEPGIKAPVVGLDNWRAVMIPVDIWENPYLKAFLNRKQQLLKITFAILFIAGFAAGYGLRG